MQDDFVHFPPLATHRSLLARASVRATGAIVVLAVVLALLPGRSRIAPVIGSDYCYQLMAADRLVAGEGLTAIPPAAPLQPWEWRADWAFLTQWPCGYSLLIAALRAAFGLSSLDACRWIAVVACAAALVGWFVWVGRCVSWGAGPHGGPYPSHDRPAVSEGPAATSIPWTAKRWLPRGAAVLLAAVTAGFAVSPALLVNPSTDLLLIAGLPYVLLAVARGVELRQRRDWAGAGRRGRMLLVIAGLLAGVLLWFRYAAVFVPTAVGVWLLLRRDVRPLSQAHGDGGPSSASPSPRSTRLHDTVLFIGSSAVPIITLLAINRLMVPQESAQTQLNLGHGVGFDFSWRLFGEVWWRLTDLGFYDYRWYSHWVFTLWPAAFVGLALAIPAGRRALGRFLAMPRPALSATVACGLLVMLVAASTLFAGKFDYVGLDRYYLPVRPLYFVLFAAPMLLVRWRAVRVVVCFGLLVAGSWIVQQEWRRPYERWLSTRREATPYGQSPRCFPPDPTALYEWLEGRNDPALVVVSNFHEFVALETGVPALPIPPDRSTLDAWLERIRDARGVKDLRVLFVLDPESRWRSYWIRSTPAIISDFTLYERLRAPGSSDVNVFVYRALLPRQTDGASLSSRDSS